VKIAQGGAGRLPRQADPQTGPKPRRASDTGRVSDGREVFTPTGLDAPPPGFGPPAPRRGRWREWRRHHRGLAWLLGVIAILAVVVTAGPLLFFDVLEGKAPARLTLPPTAGRGPSPAAAGPVSGTWTVSTGSQAGYRVQEILFGQHHTAVGRTPKVSGRLVISGTTVTEASFSVDMAAVTSDQASRDAQFHGFIMETYKYAHASFRLTTPIQLGAIPAPGKIVTDEGDGELSMRGVSHVVTFAVHAERVAGGLDVSAEIPITFSVWHIPNPSFAIAQVGNTGLIEVLLHLVPA
jgi:polyisoprenoid-binding protein YceI